MLFRAFLAFAYAKGGHDQSALEALTVQIEMGADSCDYYVELAIDAEMGMDDDLATKHVKHLKNIGKPDVAATLHEWMLERSF